ncbi:MAG: hypothetical protein JRM76_01070 [Nitrososphaerota archaeon]|jgi:hypothetical protein|nr:hypothetical protein [Nitrososphaerota archaeon]MDG6903362.1 hypothetical protein [Nitrososphaerota archaeon]MDG6911776.1 hypothetical protein [Nitrososphaerota archaeon]MDG6940742.1 hypothetical protein [Nitrososphaerota archaeon]MDG6945653.1 hypothetical protein [Nitrososphaerota archaeon]
MEQTRLDDYLRVIELCRDVETSSANPFDVDIREKILLLKKRLPELKLLDELLVDSEAMLELAQIVKLQDQWLKSRASALFIDPLLIQLKVKLLSKESLTESFVKSWHPIAQVDQLSPRGLEKAFIYWRELVPISERFKDQFGSYGVRPGTAEYTDLVSLGVFTKEQFEVGLTQLHDELLAKSNGDWVDYRQFIEGESFETKVRRAYLLAFLISEGRALLKTEPLTGRIWTMGLTEKTKGIPKSVAISITGES